MASESDIRWYSMGTREGRVLLGMRGRELGVLGLGIVAALATVASHKSVGGAIAAVLMMCAGAAMAWMPVRGEVLTEWVVRGTRWGIGRMTGLQSWRHSTPERSEEIQRHGTMGALLDPEGVLEDLPGELGTLELWKGPGTILGTAYEIGVIRDRRADTYTGVLLVRASSNYGLLGSHDQERLCGKYGAGLASLAVDKSPVRRIGFIERTLPDPTDRLVEDLHTAKDPGLEWEHSAVQSYVQLLEGAGRQADEHELLYHLTVSGSRARKQSKKLGWNRKEAPVRVVIDQLALLATELKRADIEVRRPLSTRGCIEAIRTGLDPWSRNTLSRLFGQDAVVDISDAAPTAREEEWDRVVVDGSQHAVLWVSAWPRRKVTAMSFSELLLSTGCTRTVSLVMELVGPTRSVRDAEQQVADDESNYEMRMRSGKRTSSRTRRVEGSHMRREDEMAEGQIDIRYCGFVVVSAPGTQRPVLETAVATVTGECARAGMQVERMYGAQAQALTFGLPLGRGLA